MDGDVWYFLNSSIFFSLEHYIVLQKMNSVKLFDEKTQIMEPFLSFVLSIWKLWKSFNISFLYWLNSIAPRQHKMLIEKYRYFLSIKFLEHFQLLYLWFWSIYLNMERFENSEIISFPILKAYCYPRKPIASRYLLFLCT